MPVATINDVTSLPFGALDQRGISHAIAQQYGVRVEYDEGSGAEAAYYFPLHKQGQLVGYQRKAAKAPGSREAGDVVRVGETKGCDPFGAHITGNSGQFIIVTEGAEDALATSQILANGGKRYRVVSTLGTDGWKRQLQFFQGYEKVVICFDADEGGRKAAREFSAALKPGQGYVMELDETLGTDPNAYLVAGKHREFFDALNRSSQIKPDGVIALSDAWPIVEVDDEKESVPYPWEGLNALTYGMRQRELVTITAGTGVGKSAMVRELAVHLLKTTKDNIGLLCLEESVKRTAWGLMGVAASRPLHLLHERKNLTADERRKLFNKVFGGNRLFAYDHWGSTNVDNLVNKVRYMVAGLGCKWVFLDHLSIVVSSQDGENGEERRAIDKCMTSLRGLVEETGAGLFLVSHLKRVDGSGHEEGHVVSLSHLRGSQAIAQLSDMVIAGERDQQAPDPIVANTTAIRVLKNRYSGLTGLATTLQYDRTTGRLNESAPVQEKPSEQTGDSGSL